MFQKEVKMSEEHWKKEVEVMEQIQLEVEGEDDREYEPEMETKKRQ